MQQSHWLLCVVKNCGWSRKITPLSNVTRASLLVEWKLYSESRIELRNLQILEKIWKSSSHFLSSEQPCEPKSLDFALKIAGVEKIRSVNFAVAVNLEVIRFEFWMKGTLVTVEICVLCGWWFSNQFEIVSETPFSCDTVSRELYFARCCALKRTGTFSSAGKEG